MSPGGPCGTVTFRGREYPLQSSRIVVSTRVEPGGPFHDLFLFGGTCEEAGIYINIDCYSLRKGATAADLPENVIDNDHGATGPEDTLSDDPADSLVEASTVHIKQVASDAPRLWMIQRLQIRFSKREDDMLVASLNATIEDADTNETEKLSAVLIAAVEEVTERS